MSDVDDYVAALDPAPRETVQAIRALVLAADPAIREGIKWNAPSFAVRDWFATLNLRPKGPVRVVLHTGAKAVPGHPDLVVDDPEGLLAWQGKDRAIVAFTDAADVEAKRAAFTGILKQWVPQLP
jgi:hypothetical protein